MELTLTHRMTHQQIKSQPAMVRALEELLTGEVSSADASWWDWARSWLTRPGGKFVGQLREVLGDKALVQVVLCKENPTMQMRMTELEDGPMTAAFFASEAPVVPPPIQSKTSSIAGTSPRGKESPGPFSGLGTPSTKLPGTPSPAGGHTSPRFASAPVL